MNLYDMANYVASKVRQTDQAAIARCRLFLRQRYEMLWHEALWRASVFRHDFTFDPAPDFADPPPFTNYWSNPGVTAAGVTTGGGVQMLPAMVDKVLALRRADAGIVVEVQEGLFRAALDEFEESGTPMKFAILPPCVLDIQRADENDVESEGVGLSHAAADAGAEMAIRYLDFDGEAQEETVTLSGSGLQLMTGTPQTVLSVTKPATTAAVAFLLDTDTLFSIPAAATAATVRARLRLLPRPNEETPCKCLVKKKPAALVNDADAPELIGVENALMCFAEGDMYQHARQLGKQQAKVGEGLALLEQYKRLEVVQQASRGQITPDVAEMSGDWENSKAWYV